MKKDESLIHPFSMNSTMMILEGNEQAKQNSVFIRTSVNAAGHR